LNAYVDPVVSLDLDVVIASHQLADVEPLLEARFNVERFPHSLNVSGAGSDLRIQIQLDSRYSAFVGRARVRDVLGLPLPVATLEDVLQVKIWAVQDATRRGSKRQKDLADIARSSRELRTSDRWSQTTSWRVSSEPRPMAPLVLRPSPFTARITAMSAADYRSTGENGKGEVTDRSDRSDPGRHERPHGRPRRT